jgi:CRP-like cAMP-binding protein
LRKPTSLFAIERGEALYRAGDEAACVWAVANGQMKVIKRSESGRQLLLGLVIPGEQCGADCYAKDAQFEFSAFAIEPTTALCFSATLMRECAEVESAFSTRAGERALSPLVSCATHAQSCDRDRSGTCGPRAGLSSNKFGDEIPHSRSTLAQLPGTSVESAIRATRFLSEKGILNTGWNKIQVASLPRLKELAHKGMHKRGGL